MRSRRPLALVAALADRADAPAEREVVWIAPDAAPLDLRHTPDARSTPLGDFTLAPDEIRNIHLEAMVPGLTSIPQALLFESVP